MSKFLVTGGAGFIGGNFLLKMVRKYPNDTWVCLDSLTYAGDLEKLQCLFSLPNFTFVQDDICNKEGIYRLFEEERFDYVINFAAESHVDRSIKDPDIFLKTNILGVENLMNACLKYGIKRFHQVSTDEVYGDSPIDGKTFFDESSSLHPSNPYSASKASADLLILSYHRTYGLPISISRSSNNFGPYQYPEKLIPFVIKRALNDEPVLVYGDGLDTRDWIYVEDHNDAIDLILRKGKDGEIYNITAHNERRNIDIVQRILKRLGKEESLIQYVQDRPGHDRRYPIDSNKIEKEVAWKPSFSFEETLDKTIDWNVKNEDWLTYVETKGNM